MKKMIPVLLLCKFCFTTVLFPQQPDPEIQRFNQLRDSLYRAGLARDSAFREQLDESLRKLRQSIAETKQQEVERATQEVIQQHEKTYKAKRRTVLLALSAFLIALFLARILFTLKRKKASPSQ